MKRLLSALVILGLAFPAMARPVLLRGTGLQVKTTNGTTVFEVDSTGAITTGSVSAGAAGSFTTVTASTSVLTPIVDVSAAGALAIGNTTATSVSIGNSAACDTITIGSNADADTITIGDSTDTAVSITDDNWSVTAAGVGTFASVVTNTITGGSATTLTVGDTVSTAVSIGNSAAADTITIGTNTDADAITVGDWANDTVKIEGAVARPKSGTTLTAADVNITKATLQASRFTLVDTTSNAVDVDFADDAALDAADVGSEWVFIVSVGGTNALTVSAGASGVTTVVTHNATTGTTAEDVGDMIRCTAFATTKIACEVYAAD